MFRKLSTIITNIYFNKNKSNILLIQKNGTQSIIKKTITSSTVTTPQQTIIKPVQRPLILGIETSCDDTGAALVDGNGTVHGECLISQQSVHLRNGGIIPPIAQNLHRQNIQHVVAETLRQANNNVNIQINDVDAIAVTNRPGLTLSLLVGVRYAKHLCRQYNKPLIPIHHMEAHAITARINKQITYPYLCLLASGGHCLLTFVNNSNQFDLYGESIDDAPGEAFDKISRRLKLITLPEFQSMNGGQAIELAASRSLNPNHFEFPLPLARQRNCQFSFSGLKNTAQRHIERVERELCLPPDSVIPNYEDFCYGFLRAITRHILHRTQRAMEYCEMNNLFGNNTIDGQSENKKQLVFSGGVACNNFIFNALTELAQQYGYICYRPEPKYCTDNGLMIAWNGVERWLANQTEYQKLNIDEVDTHPKCPIGKNIIKQVEDSSISCKWAKLKTIK